MNENMRDHLYAASRVLCVVLVLTSITLLCGLFLYYIPEIFFIGFPVLMLGWILYIFYDYYLYERRRNKRKYDDYKN